MRKILVFVLLLASAVHAADLQVMDLQYVNGRLVANIFNQAPDGIEDDILVRFYDNGAEIGSRTYTDVLPRYSVFSVYIDYIPAAGMHDFKAVVDPAAAIAESNDGNNDRSITYEQKLDLEPRAAQPEGQEPVAPAAVQPIVLDTPTTTYVLSIVVIVLAVLLALRLLHIRGYLKKHEKKEPKRVEHEKKRSMAFPRISRNSQPSAAKEHSVASALRMQPGSGVKLRAKLIFNGQAGGDYTYFVKDATGEAVGVSSHRYGEKEYDLECVVETVMKSEKVLRIKSAG